MIKRIVLLFTLFLPSLILIARTTINVVDQASFESIQKRLNIAIKSGEEDIIVLISSGNYIAKENFILLNKINAPDVKIRVVGDEAIIIPEGNDYKNGNIYLGKSSEYNSWMSKSIDVKRWSDIRYAVGQVEILDDAKKLCRIKSKDQLISFANGASHLLIPHWYQSSIFKIDRISGNYIYFTATDLKKSYRNGYNVNDDFNYGKKEIRFKLLNAKGSIDCARVVDGKVYLPTGIPVVREGIVNRYFTILDSRFKSIEISGIKFWGNSNYNAKSAFYIRSTDCNTIWIHDCEFKGMRSSVFSFDATNNVLFENNSFTDCYDSGVQFNSKCKNLKVKDNTFINMGKSMQNSSCIVCQGENYLISGNKMKNYGYCGIKIGVWYKSKNLSTSYGIVENNELLFTDDYIADIANYGIMDSGAIHVATKNKEAIIRNNYIHGYSGMRSNRGIFCDDGAYNVQIYGNIITGIVNSYCIDSRRVESVEKSNTPESGIDRANVNIIIRDNIVDGRIRFEGNETKNNGCVKGVNYVLKRKDVDLPKNVNKNIVNWVEDVYLDSNGTSNDKIRLSTKSFKLLKKSKAWKSVSKHVERD